MFKNFKREQLDNLAFIGSVSKGVAHNINTPLSAITGRTEMLQLRLQKLKEEFNNNEKLAGEGIEKSLRDVVIIIDNAYRIADIVRNMMQKSINEQFSGTQSINLAMLLKEELKFLEADLGFKHDIEKVYQINENVPSIAGNYAHFSNSFLHIIENCKQAMLQTEQKKLMISLDSNEKEITLVFHDSGCGIKPEKRKQLLKILENPPPEQGQQADQEGGIYQIAKLLKPYKAQFDIVSKPGDTVFSVCLPL